MIKKYFSLLITLALILSFFVSCFSGNEEISSEITDVDTEDSVPTGSEYETEIPTEMQSHDDELTEETEDSDINDSTCDETTDQEIELETEAQTDEIINNDTERAEDTEETTEAEIEIQVRKEIEQRYFIFRIWNFDILSIDEFKSIVDRVVLDGFNAIKIHIPWHHVETVSGIYDYSPFDPMLDYVINEKGLKVAVSIDFTRTKGDRVLTEADIMRDSSGGLCIGGSAPGNRMQISLNSQNAIDKANLFYADAVSHFEAEFGGEILFYLPAFSQYAESEYWCTTTYDYSVNAISAFREFLKEKYASIEDLNNVIGTKYTSFGEVDPPITVSSDALGQLWYLFRHRSLKVFIDTLSQTQKKIVPDSKFALQFGSVWDSNAVVRGTLGFVDLCENADVLWVDDGPLTDHRFSMDYLLTALPSDIELAQEIDGPYHSVATPELYLAQGMQCFERGATYMSIANWSINEDYERYSYAWREIAKTWLSKDHPEVVYPNANSPVIEISLLEIFRVRNILTIMEKHKALAPNGEAVRIVITDDLTDNIPTEKSDFWVFPGNFSNVQGQGGWYYRSHLNGKFTDMTYDAVSNKWQGDSTYTMISGTYFHPDAHDAALIFKAEKAGTLSILINCLVPTANSDGVILSVKKGSEQLDLGGGKRRMLISPNVPYDKVLTVTVEEGEEIAFIINKNKNNGYDSTSVSVYIQYQ